MKIEVDDQIISHFPFKKFIDHMVLVVPANDLKGLQKIIIRKEAPKKKYKMKGTLLANYFYDINPVARSIEVYFDNIIGRIIPYYAFEIHFEIGALLLSPIIFHEIGHHVHFNKRHGIKKKKYEKFAEKYEAAGYGLYFRSRFSKILSSYKWASWNFYLFNKKERSRLKEARNELVKAYLNNVKKIEFPSKINPL